MHRRRENPKIPKEPVKHVKQKMIYHGVILERFKRLNSVVPHELDWESSYFIKRYLSGRRSH